MDEEEKKMRKLAAEADDKEESYYRKAMDKKAEQSRVAQLQAPPKRRKKPPISEEALEEAVRKRKAPFAGREDYDTETKLSEVDSAVLDMIIEGYPMITKSSRSGSLEDRLTFSADDQLKNAKEELERQYKKHGLHGAEKQTEIRKEDDRRGEAMRRRDVEYIKQDAKGKGSLLALRRLVKGRSREAQEMDVHPHPAYTMKARKETFLEFLLRRGQRWKKEKQRRRDETLPARKPQQGDEGYYFGKGKK
tara:strand:- start:94 stop:840 length:747 start_codon:yes stop_codon:yes gene_type:complete